MRVIKNLFLVLVLMSAYSALAKGSRDSVIDRSDLILIGQTDYVNTIYDNDSKQICRTMAAYLKSLAMKAIDEAVKGIESKDLYWMQLDGLKGDAFFACEQLIFEFDANEYGSKNYDYMRLAMRLYCAPRPLSKMILMSAGRRCIEDPNPDHGCHDPETLQQIDAASGTELIDDYLNPARCF